MNQTAVRERPIIFSGPMVRAILDGRKTQTRRVIPARWQFVDYLNHPTCRASAIVVCKFGNPGDRLWVREAFCQKIDENGMFVYNADGNLDPSCYYYRADGVDVRKADGDGGTEYNKDGSEASPWSSPIHMPRYASRITLEIVRVRVERLQSITEADAIAEGFKATHHGDGSSATDAFEYSWDQINASRGHSWALNPWVWAITFKRIGATP